MIEIHPLIKEHVEKKNIFDTDKIGIGDIVKFTYNNRSWFIRHAFFWGDTPGTLVLYGIVTNINGNQLIVYRQDERGKFGSEALYTNELGVQYELEVVIKGNFISKK